MRIMMTRGNTVSTMVKRRRFQSPQPDISVRRKRRRPRPKDEELAGMLLRLPIATTLAIISQGEIVYILSSINGYLLYHICLFRPGDRLRPVCLMSMPYNGFIENLGAPWSSGARGPGPNGPVVDPPLNGSRVVP